MLRVQRPLSSDEVRALCERTSTASDEHQFVALLRSSGSRVGLGHVRLHAARARVASIGYSVLPTLWGHGIGTELGGRLVEFAFDTLRATEVRATTLDENAASARVLKKLGFLVVEAGASEVDSRGAVRRVVRWSRRRAE